MSTYSMNVEGKYIPASQRPDGTWRKARRVKDGYVPQEEVPLYESKGKQFAQRRTGLPPGLCPDVVEAAKKEREKKEKSKAKKDAAAAAVAYKQPIPGVLKLPANTTSNIMSSTTTAASGQKAKTSASAIANGNKPTEEALSKMLADNLKLEDEPQDLHKKCKKLQKKLREIDEIEKKINSGDLKKPEKDQLDKVARKKTIEKELERVLAELGES